MESLAFGRLAINGLSILRLTPESSCCAPVNGMQPWDLTSVCSLGRNLIETYLALHYFAQEDRTAQELELRKNVWEFHEASERFKMLRAGLSKSVRLPELQQNLAVCRRALEVDASFQGLPKDKRQLVLHGKLAKLLTCEELCASAGISTNYHTSMFKYGSNHTHSSPFSFAQLDSFNAGDESARQVFRMPLHVSTGFIALGIRDHLRLWPDQSGSMNADEKHLVRMWEDILKWDKNPWFTGSV